MEGLLVLIVIVGSFVYCGYYLLAKSMLWKLFGPLINHVKETELERFMVKDFEDCKLRDIDFDRIPGERVKITVRHVARPLHLSKVLLERAKTTPQKLFHTKLWIYRDYIFPSRPTKARIRELFGE